MKRIPGLICISVFVCLVGLSACANEASDAKESPKADQSSTADKTDVSKSAYEDLKKELQQLQLTATTQQKMIEAALQAVKMLKKFIEEYPGSEEALDAKIQIGMIYSSTGSFEEAASYLKEFIEDSNKDDERAGYAHFYLARAYENTEKFDTAKEHYKVFVNDYAYLNPQFTAQAQASLDDMDVRRKLAVEGTPIPFTVESLDGTTLSLADFKGKVVLLDFWATWCVPCKVEMPNVIRIHKKFNEKGFEIIGISLDKDKGALERYIKANNMEWPQHFDGKGWGNGVAQKYRVRSIPATYLIDKKGRIRYRSLRGKELEEAVKKLLNET